VGIKISRRQRREPPAQVGIKTHETLDKFLYMQLEFLSFFMSLCLEVHFLRSENVKNVKRTNMFSN
jgi:hypothetical protein